MEVYRYVLYTDGASSNNQNPDDRKGGWGAVVFMQDPNGTIFKKEVSGAEDGATNNRMELMAVLMALRAVVEPEISSVKVFSDSRYVVDIFSKWIKGWKAKGWKKKGGPILNLELIQEIDREIAKLHDYSFEHVKGHNGHEHNERADQLATEAKCS